MTEAGARLTTTASLHAFGERMKTKNASTVVYDTLNLINRSFEQIR